jgi:hypothetical protein
MQISPFSGFYARLLDYVRARYSRSFLGDLSQNDARRRNIRHQHAR